MPRNRRVSRRRQSQNKQDATESSEEEIVMYSRGKGGKSKCTTTRIKVGILLMIAIGAGIAAFIYRTQVEDFLFFPASKKAVNPSDVAVSAINDATSMIGEGVGKATEAVGGAAATATAVVGGVVDKIGGIF